mmetsp:Transcript_21444/g.52545  ORF Transcript_21444/g.52545 Transcript_21444/m.52545 type:complete len:227 (+) Transcript_21444:1492-2172(+)
MRKYTNDTVLDTYKRLDFVQKSDLFRYVVLYYIGGVYADHDAQCIKPLKMWPIAHGGIGLILGVEGFGTRAQKAGLLWANNPQYVQWTLASRPKHPVLKTAIDTISERMRGKMGGTKGGCEADGHESCIETIKLTGPGLFSDAVYAYLQEQHIDPEETVRGAVVGSVQIMTVDSFACGQMHSGSDALCLSDEVLVKHKFAGNWKTNREEGDDMLNAPPSLPANYRF